MQKRTAALLPLLLGALAAPAATQVPPVPLSGEPELVDRVLAVVGDSVVLQSEVEEQLLDLARAGQPLPQDPVELDRLREEVTNGMVEELVLLQAAARDTTISVQQQQLDQMVDQDLERRAQQFGGRRAMEQLLAREGLTWAEYRDILMKQYRRRELIQVYLSKQRSRALPPVTEDELRAYFEAQRERFGNRPATVTFRQVVVAPQASDSARMAARARLEQIRQQVLAGDDFAALARRHSDDPGSRELGGDLGWFRQGRMVEAFDRAVFAMRPGQVSGIVESPFGFHLIKLEKVKGAERQARHILITPELDSLALTRARERAEEVARRLREGGSLDSLAALHHDAAEQGEVGPYPRDELPPPYGEVLGSADEGDILGPVTLGDEGVTKLAVIRVEDVSEAGEVSFEDVRANLRRELQQQKLVAEVVAELRQRMHVDIRL
ncbi:MAG TPA: peptidylprolyl isomerase [Longimicrobiales bacterium]|nr:peptidylprolyl isomerase [Longimicrobiales bacterium]